MIRITGLEKSFSGQPVLRQVSGELASGKVLALVGASGAGKSTLLRCLNGLESFDQGSIEIAGERLEPGGVPERDLVRLRTKVGMLFQELHLFPHLSVLDNVTLAPRVSRRVNRATAEEKGLYLLARFGLEKRAQAFPSALSGGEKQRVALARALAQDVEVLLLDEPTSALDPELRDEVRDLLRSLADGIHTDRGPERKLTLLLVTHEHKLARELSDEVWILAGGKVSARGAPADVLGTRA